MNFKASTILFFMGRTLNEVTEADFMKIVLLSIIQDPLAHDFEASTIVPYPFYVKVLN